MIKLKDEVRRKEVELSNLRSYWDHSIEHKKNLKQKNEDLKIENQALSNMIDKQVNQEKKLK